MIAAKLGLVNFFDFRLTAEDENNTRVLDKDELIFKLVFPGNFGNEL